MSARRKPRVEPIGSGGAATIHTHLKQIDNLDPGISHYVNTLRLHGVETYESCEGTEGHSYTEPTIRFDGGRGEGWRALAVALVYAFPVSDLRRGWVITENGEPVEAHWELVFRPGERS